LLGTRQRHLSGIDDAKSGAALGGQTPDADEARRIAREPQIYGGRGSDLPANIIDTYAKVAFTKLYKTPINAADLLNDRVVPFISQTAAY
jgi:hypothetical protein